MVDCLAASPSPGHGSLLLWLRDRRSPGPRGRAISDRDTLSASLRLDQIGGADCQMAPAFRPQLINRQGEAGEVMQLFTQARGGKRGMMELNIGRFQFPAGAREYPYLPGANGHPALFKPQVLQTREQLLDGMLQGPVGQRATARSRADTYVIIVLPGHFSLMP